MIGKSLLGPIFGGRSSARWGANNQLRLPRNGLLVYFTRPFSDNLLIPESEVYDETAIDIGFAATPLPGATTGQVQSAVGHTSGVASYWFDSEDEPITRLAVGFGSLSGEGISELAGINTANVLFKLRSAAAQTGVLAVYAADTDAETLTKAKDALKIT